MLHTRHTIFQTVRFRVTVPEGLSAFAQATASARRDG